MDAVPDELYTLRAQYWLGHYVSALQEAKQIARRVSTPEREEFQIKAYTAARMYDKIDVDASSSEALQALACKAQYEAAAGNPAAHKSLLEKVKTLAVTGGPTAQLAAAQVCLMAGELAPAYAFVCDKNSSFQEHQACKIQVLLQCDRLDLAEQTLRSMPDESVLTDLCSVYVNLAKGATGANEAEHTLTALSEQYGPSVMLLNLLSVALTLQGDVAAAMNKLSEAQRDFPEIVPQHETFINLAAAGSHQGQVANVSELLQTSTPTHTSLVFASNLERVTTAFDREAQKYKV